jgi:arylsulfatase A-like enzyme
MKNPLLLSASFAFAVLTNQAMSQPNILFIFTDQQRTDSLGSHGESYSHTPNLDRLAERGVVFENAYTTSPLCTPARASLQTGLYPFKHGMQTNLFMSGCMIHELADNPRLLSRQLDAAGYQAGLTGKWHLGYGKGTREDEYYRENWKKIEGALHNIDLPEKYLEASSLPTDFGYIGDDFPGHGGGGFDYPQFLEYLQKNNLELKTRTGDARGCFEVLSGEESTVDHFLTNRAIELMEEMRGADKPFFMMVNYWGPHSPYYVPTRFLDKHRDRTFQPWKSFAADQTNKPRVHNLVRSREDWDYFQEALRYNAAYVEYMDYEIGRLLAWLDESGLAENTYVIFSSDHGDSLGIHGGLTDKALQMYEETIAVPLIVRPPGGHAEGRKEDALVSLVDVYSTVLDIAGVPPESHERHGRSLLPMVRGETVTDWPEVVVTEGSGHNNAVISQRMIRDKRYKYVFNAGDTEELYDLENDPHELTNLAVNPQSRELLKTMRAKLLAWMEEKGDSLHLLYARWCDAQGDS